MRIRFRTRQCNAEGVCLSVVASIRTFVGKVEHRRAADPPAETTEDAVSRRPRQSQISDSARTRPRGARRQTRRRRRLTMGGISRCGCCSLRCDWRSVPPRRMRAPCSSGIQRPKQTPCRAARRRIQRVSPSPGQETATVVVGRPSPHRSRRSLATVDILRGRSPDAAGHPKPRAERAIGEGWYRYGDSNPGSVAENHVS